MLVKVRSNATHCVILLVTILAAAVEINAYCGGHFSTDTGTLHSPNYPSSYYNDQECTWTIQLGNRHSIRLEFQQPFALESQSNCDYDSVKVYDVDPYGSRNLRGTWCGTNPPRFLVSSASKVEVKFKSDGSNTYKGFSVSWSKTGYASCGGHFSTDTGTLHSSNYPSSYNDNEDCTWTIQVDNRHRIRLEFQQPFELESDCGYDSVKVFDVDSYGSQNLRGTWCGTNLPPTLESSTSKVEVKFKSDGSLTYKGFSVSWNKIGHASCGGHFSTDTGTLHSSNYPSSYNDNEDCTWTIQVDNRHRIRLEFQQPFELESSSICSYDNVKVFDVDSYGSRSLRGTWCGINLPPTLESSTSKVEVKFKSDGSETYKGFSASWNKISEVPCGGNFNTDHGTLHSPNYPSKYNDNDHCIWRISVDDGYRIHLKFNAPFNLEHACDYDYVKVYDVLSSGRRILRGTWCDSNLPKPLVSITSKIEVVFKSDGSGVYTGFSASWNKFDGGETTEMSEEAVLIVSASVVIGVISIAILFINEKSRSNRRARVHSTEIPLPHRVNQNPFPEMPHTQPSGPPPSYEEAVNNTYM